MLVRVGWCSVIMDIYWIKRPIPVGHSPSQSPHSVSALYISCHQKLQSPSWSLTSLIALQGHQDLADGETCWTTGVHLQAGSGGGSDREIHEVSISVIRAGLDDDFSDESFLRKKCWEFWLTFQFKRRFIQILQISHSLTARDSSSKWKAFSFRN